MSQQTKTPCPHCGKKVAPGPMVNHIRTCESNPDREGLHIDHHKVNCRYCGKTSTPGAIANHEKYGCPNRPIDLDEPDGLATCPTCGLRTTAGPLVSHMRTHERELVSK